MTVLIPGLFGLDSASAYRTFTKDPQKYLDRFAKDPRVKKEIDYFQSKAGTYQSVDELLKDRRATQFLLDAYGLGAEIKNLGRIKRILTEDPTQSSSLVNRLVDSRFKAMADSLRLDQGMTKLQRITFRDVIETKYIQNQFEENLGSQDPALRKAAYFARSSGGIQNVFSILGDSILREVVTSTYNIPQQIAIQPVETQAREISRRVDIRKFSAAVNSINVSAIELQNAKADFNIIQKNLNASDSARNQVSTLQQTLSQLLTDYNNLGTITDPNGINSGTIAVQNNSVPQLIGIDQQLTSANRAVDNATILINSLSDLISQASNPNNDLNDLKSQFTSLVTTITNAINNAIVILPDGSSENILMSGSNSTLTIPLDSNGNTIEISKYDSTNLLNTLASAQNAFDTISDSNDSTNILLAQARVLTSLDSLTNLNASIETDQQQIFEVGNSTLFVATLNTDSLLQGSRSIKDSLNRISQIELLLEQIGDLAIQSKNMGISEDRTELENQFISYRNQIRDIITTVGTAGLDDFLNNAPLRNYEINTGNHLSVTSSVDLLTTVADVLDNSSLLTQQDAQNLELTAIQVTTNTDSLKNSLSRSDTIFEKAVSIYDPRGKLDSQLYALQNNLSEMVSNAENEGINLLGSQQNNIILNDLSSGNRLTFNAQTNFLSSTTTALNDVINQLSSGTSLVLEKLNDFKDIVDRFKFNLDLDNRRATLEFGRVGTLIDTLEPQEETNENTTYKVNPFTEKFILRYLILAGKSSTSTNTANNYVLSLFGGGVGSDTSAALTTIFNLSVQV